MSNKIYTIVDDVVEYKTKTTQDADGVSYVMKTSKSSSWTQHYRDKIRISAFNSGDDIGIKFSTRNENDEIQVQDLKFDYEQAFELYCFLDLWHKSDPYFNKLKHTSKKPKL